ncbi:MAG: M1 family metallopeptidase [Woeseiaceae bacterium]
MRTQQFSRFFIVVLILVGLAGCSKSEPTTEPDSVAEATPETGVMDKPTPGVDYQSFANTDDYRATHVELDLSVDFDARHLTGTASIDFKTVGTSGAPLVLDTRDLTIHEVTAGSKDQQEVVEYTLGDNKDVLGAPLSIDLPSDATRVIVSYTTSPGASGLQWLTPAQTAGKQYPFLFTQAQPIHARSFAPLQDTPGVRVTYNATIKTPKELRAVMSADNKPARESDGIYQFSMPQPIPSYLLALAVGDLEFKAMGERTGVYAEASILDAAAAEFSDTESMLERTEAAYGPYQWDRYDLLILPPSFPFGGMENPRLSFITPTVIAGDKSLVALIAHELAHSWSGNLITNSSWRDLWLNEGFTTYLTNRIMQFVYGDQRYQMEMALGYTDLTNAIDELSDVDEILALDIRDRDPDEAFSNIPYEKGSLFLYELEQKVGRDVFDAFLADYFKTFEFQSIHTEDFIAYLDKTLLTTHGDVLDRDRIMEWIYAPGLPADAPAPSSDAFTSIDPKRQAWIDGELAASDIDTSEWTFHQWKYFLDGMPEKLTEAQLDALDETFSLTASTNNEIAFSWLRIAIRNAYAPADQRLENFLTSIGRNKFLRPLYQDLVNAGQRERAQRIFDNAKAGYHPLTVRRNSQILYPDE